MKSLKSFKLFESSGLSTDDIEDILEIFQYFLDEEDLDITKKISEQTGKELPNTVE